MAIPIKGQTESEGSPSTYYEYEVVASNRRADKVHIQLKLWVRMKNFSNYFSFAIGHECKVNGVYQYHVFKNDRKWWGHQWEGDYSGYWKKGSYDYNGSNWHGPYTVFDGDVPIGLDDGYVHIVPCIVRPPITGLGGTGIYAKNDMDKTNWKGRKGVWRPWGTDEQRGSWANRALTHDMAFGNNKSLQELGTDSGYWIGVYPRPSVVKGLSLSPQTIDVAKQDAQAVLAKWDASQRAKGYKVYIAKDAPGSRSKGCGSTAARSMSIAPRAKLGLSELFHGDKVYVGVVSYDSAGVEAKKVSWAGPVNYFENLSEAPNSGYVLGKKRERNKILYRGEPNVEIRYSGTRDGSYPIKRYELVRISDGYKIGWSRSSEISIAAAAEKLFRASSFPGVARPRKSSVWELRCYNTKERPVYMKGTKSWLRISVYYYGGVLYVYDGGRWHEGIAWVYDSGKWHEADAVHVHRNGDWKTL